MGKKLIKLTCLTLCLMLLTCICLQNKIVSAHAGMDGSNTESFISKSLNLNKELMSQLFGNEIENVYTNSILTIQISQDKKSADLYLCIEGKYLGAKLTGTYDQVEAEGESGYIAVFEGILPTISGRDLALTPEGFVPVIADITFSDSEMFVGLTLGYATEISKPDILFFGELTETLSRFSEINHTRSIEELENKKLQDNSNKELNQLRVDGTCRLKGYTSVNLGSNVAGVLSVFHANELRNQGIMSIYAKVNTNCDNVLSYIQNDLGFGSSAVATYADTFNISICGEHDNFHAVTNSYCPQNNSTSSTISIPVYLGPVIGVQFVSYSVTMSTTTVTPSKYSSTSPHPNNKLTWYIYKNYGWNPSDFDGGYTTSTGMTVSSSYTYEGTVLGSLSRTVGSTGSIRYEYWAFIGSSQYQLHLTTGTMSKTTYVTIVP